MDKQLPHFGQDQSEVAARPWTMKLFLLIRCRTITKKKPIFFLQKTDLICLKWLLNENKFHYHLLFVS